MISYKVNAENKHLKWSLLTILVESPNWELLTQSVPPALKDDSCKLITSRHSVNHFVLEITILLYFSQFVSITVSRNFNWQVSKFFSTQPHQLAIIEFKYRNVETQ